MALAWLFILQLVVAEKVQADLETDVSGLLTHRQISRHLRPPPVPKENPMKVYMHYMPWFQSKDFSGFWGYHWKMKTQDPAIITNGRHQIASHFYPLIGPYDSRDPDVIAYHLLLMRYSGIDGVLIDWYGSHRVSDFGPNLDNSEALISQMESTGLQFGIVWEEWVCKKVADETVTNPVVAAQEDMRYMEERYFTSPMYIKDPQGSPLLLTFGPRHFQTEEEWTEIFSHLKEKITFCPLWGSRDKIGHENAQGEFAWVDFDEEGPKLKDFYKKHKKQEGLKSEVKGQEPLMMGSACPGFHDFYEEGGAQHGFPYLHHNNGRTLRKRLQMAMENNLEYLQLVTWNDYGEGTMIEPTEEFGFTFLKIIQEFTQVPYGETELQLVHQWFVKKKEQKLGSSQFDEAYEALVKLDVAKAKQLLK